MTGDSDLHLELPSTEPLPPEFQRLVGRLMMISHFSPRTAVQNPHYQIVHHGDFPSLKQECTATSQHKVAGGKYKDVNLSRIALPTLSICDSQCAGTGNRAPLLHDISATPRLWNPGREGPPRPPAYLLESLPSHQMTLSSAMYWTNLFSVELLIS